MHRKNELAMNVARFRQRLKPWMLPIAMIAGVLFYDVMEYLAVFAPYLIFIMLLITFCKVKPSEFRVTRLSWLLLFIQIVGAVALYVAIAPFSRDVAIGTFICVFCPTATAAPVITGMLGGSVSRVATYSIVSNLSVAVLAPVAFTLIGDRGDIDFRDTTLQISLKVVPLILSPLALALVMQRAVPRVHSEIARRQSLSFYIWAVALFIVVGRAVSYIVRHHENVGEMVILAAMSLVVCCLQFYAGRVIGRHCGDRIAGAQGLGQKNTVLAIWMAFTLTGHPIASIAPAAYVAWQNTINSVQLYMKSRRDKI